MNPLIQALSQRLAAGGQFGRKTNFWSMSQPEDMGIKFVHPGATPNERVEDGWMPFMTPNARVAQGHEAAGSGSPMQQAMGTPPQQPQGTPDQAMQGGVVQGPQAASSTEMEQSSPMSWMMQQGALQRDRETGDFLDPELAKRAAAQGGMNPLAALLGLG